MRRNRKSIWTRGAAALVFSAAIGLAVMLGCTAVFAAFTYFLMDNMAFGSFFTSAAICVGAISGSFLCGRYRRKRGLLEGIICGLIMYAVLSGFGIVLGSGFQGIKSLLRLTVSGAVGGVTGVNSKRPKRLRD